MTFAFSLNASKTDSASGKSALPRPRTPQLSGTMVEAVAVNGLGAANLFAAACALAIRNSALSWAQCTKEK